jgi:hypothetical protein
LEDIKDTEKLKKMEAYITDYDIKILAKSNTTCKRIYFGRYNFK